MRGGEGPPGAVSIWSWSPLCYGRPLKLVLYMPIRIFAYSSNIFKANFDLMESMPACGTLISFSKKIIKSGLFWYTSRASIYLAPLYCLCSSHWPHNRRTKYSVHSCRIWTGFCSQQSFCHLPVAFLQGWCAVGQVICPPCPGFCSWPCRWCPTTRLPKWSTCTSVSSRILACGWDSNLTYWRQESLETRQRIYSVRLTSWPEAWQSYMVCDWSMSNHI